MPSRPNLRRYIGVGGRPASIRAARRATDDYGATAEPDWRTIDWRDQLSRIGGVNHVDIGPRDGDKEAVVFIHGLGGCWQNWLEQLPRVAQERRAVALDLPGFAGSPMPTWDISITGYARAVNDLCDALGLERVELVGNSMGGFIAAEMGIRHPDRCDSITLISAAGISTTNLEARPVVTFARATAAITNYFIAHADPFVRRPRLRHLMLSYVFRHPTRLKPDLALEIMRGAASPGFIPALEALAGYDFRERLPDVGVETLLVWGDKDNLVPVQDSKKFEELLPRAKRVVLEDTGHCAMIERPQTFNDLLMRFLDGGLAVVESRDDDAGYEVTAPSAADPTLREYLASTPAE